MESVRTANRHMLSFRRSTTDPFKGNPDADMLSYKRINANTLEATTKLNGKGTITAKAVVSADGKTRTVTQVGTNAQGQPLNVTSVYERQ